jgi:hypothetical protein
MTIRCRCFVDLGAACDPGSDLFLVIPHTGRPEEEPARGADRPSPSLDVLARMATCQS